jgi:hypothetical protein
MDTLTNLNVAIKLSKKENYDTLMEDGGLLHEDMREIAFLENFNHVNIVTLLDLVVVEDE